MEKNKTGKYLKYALGEILLVMVGILLALQVNNWNEQRKNSALEKNYLKDVHLEFKANKIQFEKTLNTYHEQLTLSDSLSKMFPITDENWPSLYSNYNRVFRRSSFDPSSSSINVLINSGKVDLIKNDSLKKLLLAWNNQFEDYKEEENELQHLDDVRFDIILNEPSFDKVNGVVSPLSAELKIKLVKLMKRRRLKLSLVTSRWQLNQESKELMSSIDAIISMTSQYLE
tara:strand:+ start:1142 stop:1828 length:687 start_codon:yes stop_codon:yes gene_type:complete